MFFAELVGCFDFVFELGVDLVEADVGGGAGCEAAVGVECDAIGWEKFEKLMQTYILPIPRIVHTI